MRAADSTPDAEAVRLAVLRSMTPAERLDLMVELTETVRELARAGIRMRHQDYTPEQVDLALYRHIYGAEIADKAWPESRGLGT